MLIEAIEERAPELGLAPLAQAFNLPRATIYRTRSKAAQPAESRPRPARPKPANALSKEEKHSVLEILNSPQYCDQTPNEVHADLLDQGQYLCSQRTMYRILEENQQVKERRNQLRHPNHPKPQLVASAPNQVWTWDITKLKTTQKWKYLFLYVIIDLFSRYVVGWMVESKENEQLAKKLIQTTIEKYDIEPDSLVLHSDRGSPMISKTVAQMLDDLHVDRSFSRPRVSNDNAYSESQFKTMKYGPLYPGKFASSDQAIEFARKFFQWYNNEHHHEGIEWLTPADVHFGKPQEILDKRHEAKMKAFEKNPIRFRNIPPKKAELKSEVWINPPEIFDNKKEEKILIYRA